MGMLIVSLLLVPDMASAHGSAPAALESAHDTAVIVTSADIEDPDHAEDGHPGHCHGGAFCNGVAMVATLPTSQQPVTDFDKHPIPQNGVRLMAPGPFDPPPPRLLS